MSRRPSISIYDYPEDLNPFNDDPTTTTTATTTTNGTKKINHDTKNSFKDSKHKFWTFGRSKKKQRSNSFSIKTTWNGLFGKRRDSQEVEIRKPTIATVSSTYKRGTYNGYPSTPARLSKDQQEFNEALGTLARRRKYTLDNSSRYSSTLTVNGDPGKLCEPSPQDTTTCILENLTPKAPARRFGQVSPKPTDKIPSLDYTGKENTSNGSVSEERAPPNRTPIPPKRGGPRASQRSLAPIFLNDEGSSRSADTSFRDENENVPEDYVFKRFTQDAIRKSNLSINSCVSIGSTVSAYGRKKRRAPQPPCIKEPLETPKENVARASEVDVPKTEVEVVDIARVTENIDEMTKRSRELDDNFVPTCSSTRVSNGVDDEITTERNEGANKSLPDEKTEDALRTGNGEERQSRKSSTEVVEVEDRDGKTEETFKSATSSDGESKSCDETKDDNEKGISEVEPEVEVELRRKSEDEKIETLKEAEVYSSTEDFALTRRKSSGNLSRSSSFSVKDEIEKIERQIKILESTKARELSDEDVSDNFERAGTRMSLRETRNNFFRELTENDRVKVQLKELPREQNDIRIVRIEDPPIPIDAPTEPVKIIELHISEPIRQKPEIIVDRDINPIPKPRRHSNLDIVSKETRVKVRREKEDEEKRGNSL